MSYGWSRCVLTPSPKKRLCVAAVTQFHVLLFHFLTTRDTNCYTTRQKLNTQVFDKPTTFCSFLAFPSVNDVPVWNDPVLGI